jgi:transcriptional regulator with XRE-family HTH domain
MKKDPFGAELKKIRKERGVSVPQLSDILQIPKDRIYKWEQGKNGPKYEDRELLQKWIKDGEWTNVPHETQGIALKQDTPSASNTTSEALLIIARANDKLAESNLIISRSNEILCRSNEDLVSKIRSSSAAEEDKYTLQESVYLLMGLREYMTELASVVMKKSALEVNQTLNSKVMAAKKRVENKDTPVVLSK